LDSGEPDDMALYVDSAYLDDVARVVERYPVSGVTTNPSIMLAAWERGQRLSDIRIIQEMLALVDGVVFAQPTGADDEALYAAAARYIEVAPERVVPKLPMTVEGLKTGRRITFAGGRVSFTAVASLGQAYSAALAGSSWVIPYHGRLRRAGIDPCERVTSMARLIERQHVRTRVLVASLKSAADVTDAVLSGAHDITTTPDVIETLLQDSLTAAALKQFDADWSRLGQLTGGQ
jgi:TalC/MipB family fructose-6-phosphate aldolase